MEILLYCPNGNTRNIIWQMFHETEFEIKGLNAFINIVDIDKKTVCGKIIDTDNISLQKFCPNVSIPNSPIFYYTLNWIKNYHAMEKIKDSGHITLVFELPVECDKALIQISALMNIKKEKFVFNELNIIIQ